MKWNGHSKSCRREAHVMIPLGLRLRAVTTADMLERKSRDRRTAANSTGGEDRTSNLSSGLKTRVVSATALGRFAR